MFFHLGLFCRVSEWSALPLCDQATCLKWSTNMDVLWESFLVFWWNYELELCGTDINRTKVSPVCPCCFYLHHLIEPLQTEGRNVSVRERSFSICFRADAQHHVPPRLAGHQPQPCWSQLLSYCFGRTILCSRNSCWVTRGFINYESSWAVTWAFCSCVQIHKSFHLGSTDCSQHTLWDPS